MPQLQDILSNLGQATSVRFVARASGTDWGGTPDAPRLAVRFEVSRGEHAGAEIVLYRGFSSPKVEEITLSQLRATGWQGDDLSDLSTVGSEECTIVVKPSDYNGGYEIDAVWPLGGGAALFREDQRLTPEAVKAFAARMRPAVAGGSREPAPARERRPPPPANGAPVTTQRRAPPPAPTPARHATVPASAYLGADAADDSDIPF